MRKIDTFDIEFKFEKTKRKILAKIDALKEEWQTIWEKCAGNPEAEALAVQAKLRIQLMETEALNDIKELELEIEASKPCG
jgi:hypothetical protein